MLATIITCVGVVIVYLAWSVGNATGKMKGETAGMMHIAHARMVHMTDLGNLHSLLLQPDIRPAIDYLHVALKRIESDPSVDQKMPEKILYR